MAGSNGIMQAGIAEDAEADAADNEALSPRGPALRGEADEEEEDEGDGADAGDDDDFNEVRSRRSTQTTCWRGRRGRVLQAC